MSTQAQRRKLAIEIAEIAVRRGATAEIEPDRKEVYVRCTFPGKVKVSLDVSDLHQGGILASWHSAEKPLADHTCFDSVNPHHRAKASTYRQTAGTFMQAFDYACEAIADGSAFQDGR